uniref:Uncharacterized protein n=1 Tax=Glypta fumiferanae TaxID=389681 RepID=A0A0F6Q791_9HYME|nr:hypothetical protein [Glypta fumiferanae]
MREREREREKLVNRRIGSTPLDTPSCNYRGFYWRNLIAKNIDRYENICIYIDITYICVYVYRFTLRYISFERKIFRADNCLSMARYLYLEIREHSARKEIMAIMQIDRPRYNFFHSSFFSSFY